MGKPYTVKFGSWSPDLQDVGVEMPFQWSETELPTADCLNCYYQDAAFRSIPGPASFGPTVGTQVLNAITFYDNTAGNETVFAGTANGLFALVDGTWSPIPLSTQANALGLAFAFKLGSSVAIAVAMSPHAGYTEMGSPLTYSFPALTAVLGTGSGSYNWYFGSQTGPGTWSIASGQGTSSAVAKLTGAIAGDTSTTTCFCGITYSGALYTVSAPLSYTAETYPPLLHSYESGSGTETVAAGYNNVIIEVWGGNGGGASGGPTTIVSGLPHYFGGGGGGGGGYSRSSYSVTAGQAIHWSVGTGGAGGSSVAEYEPGGNGTASTVTGTGITSMTADGGTGAPSASGGSGMNATGGNQANSAGGSGGTGGEGTAGAGGTETSGVHGSPQGTGGKGGLGNGSAGAGGIAGAVSFYFTS